MLKIAYLVMFISLSAMVPSHATDEPKEFDERTLQELVLGSERVFREFGINNLKLDDAILFIQNQIIPKHGQEMYTLWQRANNWENAGIGELKQTRDNLQQSIARVSNPDRAKQIIKGKLKDKSFLLLNLSEHGIKEKALLTVQNGRMRIEKDLTGKGYDLIFQYKFSDDVGITRGKDYPQLQDAPILSPSHGAKVLVVVIGMYEFLDHIWSLTEETGMTTENKVLELISKNPGRIKSIYALQDYSF